MPISDPLNRADATRFLQRASFGARSGDIDALITRGVDGWLDDQMAADTVETHIARRLRTASSVNRSYWRAILSEPDQLRRRVAYALSQILVASSNGIGSNEIANYMDILERNAFATFRTLLEEVSLSYAMGDYLTYAGNRREDTRRGRVPDENYAREVMQLFTIGLWELDQNGTRTLSGGAQIPTYEQEDISGLARVFTGWNRSPETTNARFSTPMVMLEDRHESGPKTFLGTTIPENTTGYDSLTIALDALASHDNVGPFVGHQLIQRLVTSNPTPAYVGRVAAVWANNGSGVRGDLDAVVRAILLDDEAWQASPPDSFGKLREPVLRLSTVTRGLDVSTPDDVEGWAFDNTSDTATSLGQLAFASPSVFNFYRPGYLPPRTPLAEDRLVAPEFQILDETSSIGWINWLSDRLRRPGRTTEYDLTALLALSDNVPALVGEVVDRLCPGGISAQLREIVERNVTSIVDDRRPEEAAVERVLATVLFIAASTDFLYER